MHTTAHRVVIIGGGFAGLNVAKGLKRAPAEVVMLDRRNHHVFQPLLYQVATGALSPANISAPLRAVLSGQPNATVLMEEVVDFDVANRAVLTKGRSIPYDTLVVAAGAGTSYFGHDEWAAHAPPLKNIEDAIEIRRRVLNAFEQAERESDPERVREWLTFVVVGGGPTGLELAGALCEISRFTLCKEFRRIDPTQARVILVEAAPRVLPPYPEDLSAKARQALEEMGAEVRTGWAVEEIRSGAVALKRGDECETLLARTILWGAGVKASPLGKKLAAAAGAETDRGGRVVVTSDCSLPGHPEIFVLGDLAHFKGADGQPLPGLAPVAMQQGHYVAARIAARLKGRELKPFKYFDKGSMATIGRRAAVAQMGRLHLSGTVAWLAWLFIHLMYIVSFGNRVLVLIQWGWSYFTRGRSARLITGRWEAEGQAPPTPAASSRRLHAVVA
ncbi:MAG: NAD(P)/FAD-dependent oxidoreductase [Planctomycetes bacterium]|nr:NAD(P)/FAD-dependent oxidoreductase [Planctomycetota bacterium]